MEGMRKSLRNKKGAVKFTPPFSLKFVVSLDV